MRMQGAPGSAQSHACMRMLFACPRARQHPASQVQLHPSPAPHQRLPRLAALASRLARHASIPPATPAGLLAIPPACLSSARLPCPACCPVSYAAALSWLPVRSGRLLRATPDGAARYALHPHAYAAGSTPRILCMLSPLDFGTGTGIHTCMLVCAGHQHAVCVGGMRALAPCMLTLVHLRCPSHVLQGRVAGASSISPRPL